MLKTVKQGEKRDIALPCLDACARGGYACIHLVHRGKVNALTFKSCRPGRGTERRGP